MSNPLKAMMGSGNPMMSIMQGMMGNARNPQLMVMNILRQQNPQGYQMLQQMMNSGQNPQDILNKMTSQMNPQQIEQVKKMASQFGVR